MKRFFCMATKMFVASLVMVGVAVYPLVCRPQENAAGQPESRPSTEEQERRNREFFSDMEVVTHEGDIRRLYTDLLKDKLAIITFFYINCPTPQPAIPTLFRLQKTLGDRLGREVVLVTITVDPQNDTLKEIQEYARRFNPQEGWYFITGKPELIDNLNRRLGNTLNLPEGHLRVFLMGNVRTGHWMRLLETAPVLALADGLQNLASD